MEGCFSLRSMIKILKYSFFDLIRSKWSLIYFLFYLAVTFGLLYMSSDSSKAFLSLSNIVLLITPLTGTLFGALYYYNSKEFNELLLALPIRRSAIFIGRYLGLSLSLSLSFLAGVCIPFLFYGFQKAIGPGGFALFLMTGVMLTLIFSAISFLIALKNDNTIKGFGICLLVWLFLSILFDGIFLILLVYFERYPLDKLALALTLLNPIDLSRIIMTLQMDISALLGYTGAVFRRFFGSASGIIYASLALMFWIAVPVWLILIISRRKDF